ncbi:hypothetical protein D3C80_2120340 [compost metagenome]
MFGLGVKAKDKYTGFAGVITVRSHYLDGSTQYCVESPVKDGKSHAEWITEGRLVTSSEVTE